MMNKEGGIVDECIVTNMGEHLQVVVNGACRHKDWAFLLKAKLDEYSDADDKVGLEFCEENAILALQGPRSADALQDVLGTSLNLSRMSFLDATTHKVSQVDAVCTISRCGYTGEDGFELMVPKHKATALAQLFLSQPTVKMAGLGCRDTLRQECGLCLYGHELDEHIGLVEANRVWTIGKRRRREGGFYGWEIVRRQLTTNVPMRLCGFIAEGMIAREQYDIFNQAGERVGYITSGTYSPTLKTPIGMAYVKIPLHKPGSKLVANNRGVMQPIAIRKIPFIQTKYYRARK